MFNSLGDQLQALCESATDELIIVAPFIKYGALNNILRSVSSDLLIHCVTRWRPDEIAMGVSDIDTWLLLRDRLNTSLWLRDNLHAKYYRADNSCLVGSANLTNTALGWSRRPNLELLVESDASLYHEFETELMTGSVEVNDDYYQMMKESIPIFIKNDIQDDIVDVVPEDDDIEIIPNEAWIPTLRHPENLYIAYKGDLDQLGTGSQIAALSDLLAFNIPPNFDEDEFNQYVGLALLQKPIIQQIDRFVETPRRFGAVSQLLSRLSCATVPPSFDSKIAWQTLMRWMLYFSPSRYELNVPRHTEVFQRK